MLLRTSYRQLKQHCRFQATDIVGTEMHKYVTAVLFLIWAQDACILCTCPVGTIGIYSTDTPRQSGRTVKGVHPRAERGCCLTIDARHPAVTMVTAASLAARSRDLLLRKTSII
jgi:hypothetical protein